MPKVAKPDFVSRENFSRGIIVGKRAEHSVTIDDMACKLGMSTRLFYRRQNDTDSFRVGELRQMVKALEWSDSDIVGFVRGRKADCYSLKDIKEALGGTP